MTDHTVVGDRVALDVGFHAARTRLRILAKGGMLLQASEEAYGEGITALMELAGPAAGLTRLAEVRLEDLTGTDDRAHIALEWEAIAADGKLFTALLADLMLVPAGDQITGLSLAGSYWPPPRRAGDGLGPVIVRCCATAVIGSFVDLVACELVHPAGPTEPTGRSPVPGDGASHKALNAAHSDLFIIVCQNRVHTGVLTHDIAVCTSRAALAKPRPF